MGITIVLVGELDLRLIADHASTQVVTAIR